jgi:CubicO group peptidase (beta-lactamase class C family)
MIDIVTEASAEAGLDRGTVAALVERFGREVESGLLPAAQMALARDGEVVLDVTTGDAGTHDRFAVFSITKAVTAAAMWKLIGDGRLTPQQRVAELLPSFGSNGKDVVTIEQLLTHTGGFPHAPLAPEAWHVRGARLDAYARWRLTAEPGAGFEYHAASAHWVLGDVITAVTGDDHRAWIRREILQPLGLQHLQLGLVPDDEEQSGLDAVRPVEIVGDPPTQAELDEVFGAEVALADLVGVVTDEAKAVASLPEHLAAGMPGGGAVSTAADLVRLYQAFLHDPADLWDPEVLKLGTATVVSDLPDPLLGIGSHRTLGLILAGDDGGAPKRGFGHTCSPQAFGHGGAGGQIALADPATGLSFSYLTNGHDRNPIREARRISGLASKAMVCVPPDQR